MKCSENDERGSINAVCVDEMIKEGNKYTNKCAPKLPEAMKEPNHGYKQGHAIIVPLLFSNYSLIL